MHARYQKMVEEAKKQGIVSVYTRLLEAYGKCKNDQVPYFPGDVYPIALTSLHRDRKVRSNAKIEYECTGVGAVETDVVCSVRIISVLSGVVSPAHRHSTG